MSAPDTLRQIGFLEFIGIQVRTGLGLGFWDLGKGTRACQLGSYTYLLW